MGTDIHGVFQRHDGTAWVDVPTKYDCERHYQLFAVLAGVRNGYGFAGVVTGEPVKPISEPRGLPADFEVIAECHPLASLDLLPEWRRKHYKDVDPLDIWMGDHSHSWLTAEEMISWYLHAPVVVKRGVLDRETYEKWDKQSAPESYSGGVWGGDVVQIDESEVGRTDKKWTYVDCTWESGLREELKYFFDEVRRLQEEHGKVRFVFGFDS